VDYKLDMSTMLAIHLALRRELEWLGRIAARLVRPEPPNYMPWLLSEADQRTMGAVVGKFPPQMLTVFREQWPPAYAARDLWKGL
jgi:hypothetical protein